MLGIIIEADSNNAGGLSSLFYKFGTRTALERIIASCVRCDHAHKVILAMPANDKGPVLGTVFQSKLLETGALEHMGRAAEYFFYGRLEERLIRLYRAALKANLTDVVCVNALDLLIQPWFLSAVIELYYNAGAKNCVWTGPPEFDEGFGVEAFPFYQLASANIGCDDQNGLRAFLDDRFGAIALKNTESLFIPKTSRSFKFEAISQIPILARMLAELELGADVASLMGDFDE